MNTTDKQNGITIHYTDVNINDIIVEQTKFGGDLVPLVKYGPTKRDLIVQGPYIKMNEYGIPPGEKLNNGKKNDYYLSEESRDSMKFPLDPERSSVSTDDGQSNSEEIKEFVNVLKAIDKYIKESKAVHEAINLDSDDIEKYVPIYRKPKPVKKGDTKVKSPYIKTKLATQHPNKTQIITKFYNVSKATNEKTRVLTSGSYITLEDLEKFYTFNCEQQPVIKFVKVWTQNSGGWGITTKLMLSRIRKSERVNNDDYADFIDEKPSKQPQKQTLQQVDSSDDEPIKHQNNKKEQKQVDSSDDEPVPQIKQAPKQKVQKQVDSSDDDEPKPVARKKVQDVESDSDEEVVKVNKLKPKVTKGKK